MKNIFFSFLILSLVHIYSAETNTQETPKSLQQKKTSSLYSQEEEMLYLQALEEEDNFLNNRRARKRYSLNEWKTIKGLAGLWLGQKLFFKGNKIIFYLLWLPKEKISAMLISSFPIMLSIKGLEYFIGISLGAGLIALGFWIMDESAINFCEGLHGKENIMEYYE